MTCHNWDAANSAAQELLRRREEEEGREALFVHPFEQETTWEGHSTIVAEIK